MSGIVWLASYPKSGNTWLRVFLANLLADQSEPVPLAELGRFASSEAAKTRYVRFAPAGLDLNDNVAVTRVRPEVQAQIARSLPGKVLLKTHNMLVARAGAPLINMAASVAAVYLVRNPLDVVISFAGHFGQSIDWAIERMADPASLLPAEEELVFELIGDWSNHVRSWTGTHRDGLLTLKYEDLLDDPPGQFAKVASFLKIKKPAAAVRRAVNFASFDRLQAAETAGGFAEAREGATFFRDGTRDQWRGVLSPDQVARIVARHREQMARFEYLPDGG
jgi:hypothetical protein